HCFYFLLTLTVNEKRLLQNGRSLIMNTEHPSKQRKPKMVGKLLTKVLFKLPNRTKRLIFVSSFLAHIQNCNSTDKAIISKLNTLLHLSSDDKALVWPMQLHEKIWGDIKIEKILHDKG